MDKISKDPLVKLELFLIKHIPRQYYYPIKQDYLYFRGLVFLGFRFICPCCNWHFRRFLPYGVKSRPNAQCPRCESVERHRLLCLYLKEKTTFFKDNLKVLDIAPNQFLQKKFKSLSNIDYISVDDSGLADITADITEIPLEDNSLDVIICYHVLEHIPNDRKAIRELSRVLKPSGWALIQSPIDLSLNKTFEDPTIVTPQERERVFGQSDHVRIYGKDYKERLEEAGFKVSIDNYVRGLKSSTIKKYVLSDNELIYLCSK